MDFLHWTKPKKQAIIKVQQKKGAVVLKKNRISHTLALLRTVVRGIDRM